MIMKEKSMLATLSGCKTIPCNIKEVGTWDWL